jgi:hypothetical protein
MVGSEVGYLKDKLYGKFTWARQWPGFAESHDTDAREP